MPSGAEPVRRPRDQEDRPTAPGSLTVTVVPAPSWLDTSMVPPAASTMDLQMARPSKLRPSTRERDWSAR